MKSKWVTVPAWNEALTKYTGLDGQDLIAAVIWLCVAKIRTQAIAETSSRHCYPLPPFTVKKIETGIRQNDTSKNRGSREKLGHEPEGFRSSVASPSSEILLSSLSVQVEVEVEVRKPEFFFDQASASETSSSTTSGPFLESLSEKYGSKKMNLRTISKNQG